VTIAATKGGFYAPLCLRCHDDGVLNNVNTMVNTTVLATNSHGFSTATLATKTDLSAIASGVLPYVLIDPVTGAANTEIQCLSCHDVHNTKKFRPFLEVSIDTLCQTCHGTSRDNNAEATTGLTNATSTHPAGALFTGDISGMASALAGGDSPIVIGAELVSNTLDVNGSVWASLTAWNSGMELTAQGAAGTGGVTCVTCHNVHFDEDDATPDNGSLYLAFISDSKVYQADDGGAASTIANHFCEYCHQGSVVIPVGYGTAPGNALTRWNPGGTTFSHPNDDVGAMQSVTVDFTWQPGFESPNVGTGASTLVCTSCHGVHKSWNAGANVKTKANTPILLNYGTAASVCDACHTVAVMAATTFRHHPVGAGTYATSGNNAGNVTCIGGDLAPGVGKCHGAGGGPNGVVAHNRATALTQPPTSCSTTCTSCHTTNPSTYTEQTTVGATYTAGGLGSHFVGDASAQTYDKGRTTAAAIGDPIRVAGSGVAAVPESATAWTTSTLASKFCATTTMICESFHRLKTNNIQSGDKPTDMLVELSGYDIPTVSSKSAAGAAQYTAAVYLCTGCHLVPAGTHPLLEADNVNPTSTTYAAVAAQGQTFVSVTPGVNMNCESCHSPHNADTDSGVFILDGPVTATPAGTTGLEWEPTIDYTDFCAVCHGLFK
jgi:predicted CXXCH cytochrome family protein